MRKPANPDTLANADYDKDGYSNLMEFALNSDPKTVESGLVSSETDGSGKLVLSFNRNTATTGVDFLVQTREMHESGSWKIIASKLGSSPWSASPGVSVKENPIAGTVTVTDVEMPESEPKRFIRLQVKTSAAVVGN